MELYLDARLSGDKNRRVVADYYLRDITLIALKLELRTLHAVVRVVYHFHADDVLGKG